MFRWLLRLITDDVEPTLVMPRTTTAEAWRGIAALPDRKGDPPRATRVIYAEADPRKVALPRAENRPTWWRAAR